MRNRKARWLAVCLCLMMTLCLAACREAGNDDAAAGESAAETTLSAQSEDSAKAAASSDTKEKKEKAHKETKETDKKDRESKSGETKAKKETKETKPSGHVLTVKKGGKEVYFTEKELAAMGRVTYKYSYRNKESEHRQFESCTGVKLSAVLNKSGFSGSRLRFRSKDGYTREFSASELKASKKAFLKTSGSSAKSVPTILTLSGSEAFRLCFGQAADDTDESGDYNAQYWVKWIESIEVL